MYFQFLIEDKSTEILVNHVMEILQLQYPGAGIYHSCKSFKGIGTLQKSGSVSERKSGQLLNDLSIYLKAFDKTLASMKDVVIVVVLDNDCREPAAFEEELNQRTDAMLLSVDHVFCVAIKEMEAWLLGDKKAIVEAYPNARMQSISRYKQDQIGETWEVLADIVYPGGLAALRKKAGGAYAEIGKSKSEWADNIGQYLDLNHNNSPSFNNFIHQLTKRIDVA